MSKQFRVISPIDQSIFVQRFFADKLEVEHALDRSKKGFEAWRSVPLAERIDVCKKVVEWFERNIDKISIALTKQMGRPIRYSPFEIDKGFKERANYMISIAQESLADIEIESTSEFRRFIRKEPFGTVFVLAPWNYPYLTSVNAIIPAILAGNSVILKHAQQTPLCAEHYREAFDFGGAPDGVFQYLHLTHEQVAQVIGDQRIQHVAFTGSVQGGYAVQSALNRRFIGAGLELGGKDPAYVDSQVDLDIAIENLVDGSFFNSGQSCCGIERIYVHENVYDDFLHGFTDLTQKYQLGDPLDPEVTLGPVVRTSAAEYIQSQIQEAIQMGAKSVVNRNLFPSNLGPTFLTPQVLINVNHAMSIMREETFGPVVGIMPVKNHVEAIKLMNDSTYGLTASIWTKDEELALSMGQDIETGTIFMNRCDYLDPALAWTGVKDSGKGCTLSKLGFDHLTRPKSFHLKL